MYVKELNGQKLQIKLRNFPEHLTGKVTGIYKPDDWLLAKIIQSDSSGIWVENPHYRKKTVRKEDGTPIPSEEQQEEKTISHMLIRWEYIDSIISCPNETTMSAEKHTTMIGFRPDED
ncbi:hypothetical protein [Pseudalkalibacillus caeni]|uniref:Uncharacterized protein n=1 Tax=Exobacillus caeni TaxID=2574798 RepID=A0A5R9EUZ6_9BACL|nr:hypothetical protein [Pseudalkalibacillus caeni]TLS35032.1 hypothetical protein FCL54_22500 [Pseudalkalibacillus caeni]